MTPTPLTPGPGRLSRAFTVLDLCTGAGGEAVGLEQAGFDCVGAVENDRHACETLRANRPSWDVREADIYDVDGTSFERADLVAAGVPCPPFSAAGKQLGHQDDRDLFPQALRIIEEARPAAVMLENVRGFGSPRFELYRKWLVEELNGLGYEADGRLLQASDFGVPQLRPRFVVVGMRKKYWDRFQWPSAEDQVEPPSVGETLRELMKANGWPGADQWADAASRIAPTLVGGSKKHGGADLGPTRAKRQWAELGVDGMGLADEAPPRDFPVGAPPKLTVAMAAVLQGFPPDWIFTGRKTAAYRQVGNAFPPPVAAAVGRKIIAALSSSKPHHRGTHPFEAWLESQEIWREDSSPSQGALALAADVG